MEAVCSQLGNSSPPFLMWFLSFASFSLALIPIFLKAAGVQQAGGSDGDKLSSHLNPDKSRSGVRWEVVDDLLVDVGTVQVLSFFQDHSSHADAALVS